MHAGMSGIVPLQYDGGNMEMGVCVCRVAAMHSIKSGCCAVIGFTLGFITQLRTGVSVWGQLNAFPFAYLWAYGLVVIGSLLNQ